MILLYNCYAGISSYNTANSDSIFVMIICFVEMISVINHTFRKLNLRLMYV